MVVSEFLRQTPQTSRPRDDFRLFGDAIRGFLHRRAQAFGRDWPIGHVLVLYVSNIDFWVQSGYFDTGAIMKPLLHTWSLSVEEQFYLIWPILIFLSLKLSRKFLAVVFTGLFVASLAGSYVYESVDPSATFFLMPFRIYEFAIGALLMFTLPKTALNPMSGNSLRIVGTVLLIGPMLFLDGSTPNMQLWSLLPCIGTCMIIAAGTSGITHTAYTNAVALFFGKISYSLYLVHWPLITLYFIATFKPSKRVNAVWRMY